MCNYYGFRRQDGTTFVSTPKNRPLGMHDEEKGTGGNRYEWGFYGAGVLRLAKAILHDRLKVAPNAKLPVCEERFAREVIQHMPCYKDWVMSYEQIDNWVAANTGKPELKLVRAERVKRMVPAKPKR